MLTAHALDPDNFAKSMTEGACAYLPKHNLSEINVFIADVLEEGCRKPGRRAASGILFVWLYYSMKPVYSRSSAPF
jgi:hypothetical protein